LTFVDVYILKDLVSQASGKKGKKLNSVRLRRMAVIKLIVRSLQRLTIVLQFKYIFIVFFWQFFSGVIVYSCLFIRKWQQPCLCCRILRFYFIAFLFRINSIRKLIKSVLLHSGAGPIFWLMAF